MVTEDLAQQRQAAELAETVGAAGSTRSNDNAPQGGAGAVKKSWASVLGGSLPRRDNKNVMEITLEKDNRGSFAVTESDCANLIRRLGLDQRPGVHVESVQICPQGRGVIFITLKKEVDIARFCRYDVLDVTASGIRCVLVKPAGKREVIVTAKGIHPNTREDVVLDYLGKFGKVFTSKVVYGVFAEGPLKGIRNGDRSYKVEIKPGSNIGSYHFIDGQKVTLRYPGQQQTCARCHQTPQCCKGKGLARRCDAEGGVKIEFTDYILDLWKKIGYSPQNLEVSDLLGEHETDDGPVLQQDGGNFTPSKAPSDAEKFTGVSLKQFPRDTDHGEIIELLVNSGLPESKKNNVNIKTNGTVIIKNLENSECLDLIKAFHGKKHFEKKLFCNGVIPLTPEKTEPPSSVPENNSKQSAEKPLIISSSATPALHVEPIHVVKPLPHSIAAGPTENSEYFVAQDPFQFTTQPGFLSNDDFSSRAQLVRRHSISLIDRSPPNNSLAADILGMQSSLARAPSKTLLSSITNLTETLSEFNSCAESFGESSSSSGEDEAAPKPVQNEVFKTMNDKKREKRGKRKHAQSPDKDQFMLKKPNKQESPKYHK